MEVVVEVDRQMLATTTRNRFAARLIRYLIAVLVAGTLTALPSYAAPPNPLGMAQRAAEEFWGSTPCNGQVTVLWQAQRPSPAIAGTEVEAWVSFQTPLGPLNFKAAPSSYTDCVIDISLASWPSYDATIEAYPQFCQMITHEYGHFEGYADSTLYAPSDLRFPLLTEANLPPICRYDISSGTGLAPNGFPPLPGTRATKARAGSLRLKRGCFEVRCYAGWRGRRLSHRR
jgi:hypothetical protein